MWKKTPNVVIQLKRARTLNFLYTRSFNNSILTKTLKERSNQREVKFQFSKGANSQPLCRERKNVVADVLGAGRLPGMVLDQARRGQNPPQPAATEHWVNRGGKPKKRREEDVCTGEERRGEQGRKNDMGFRASKLNGERERERGKKRIWWRYLIKKHLWCC